MPQDILEKEFKIDTRGYRLREVDQFLDTIIGDYEQFLNIINNLEKEKSDLLAEIVTVFPLINNAPPWVLAEFPEISLLFIVVLEPSI